jgi:CBS domain-containing protein
MIMQDIRSVVVLRDGKLAGLATLGEVLRGLDRLGSKSTNVPIAQIMTVQPVTGHPVLENDALVGIISFHDVARSAMKEVTFENTFLKSYIKDWPEQAASVEAKPAR